MTDDPLRPADLQLLTRIAEGNHWLRSVLCTLARLGTALRHEDPDRAAALIRSLAPWPWFKAGQFLFDLLEWEDFMVDGPPPKPLPSVLQPESWQRLDDLLAQVRVLLDTAQAPPGHGGPGAPDAAPRVPGLAATVARFSADAQLPPLEPGLHLYRDVVLGVWATATVAPPDTTAGGGPPHR